MGGNVSEHIMVNEAAFMRYDPPRFYGWATQLDGWDRVEAWPEVRFGLPLARCAVGELLDCTVEGVEAIVLSSIYNAETGGVSLQVAMRYRKPNRRAE